MVAVAEQPDLYDRDLQRLQRHNAPDWLCDWRQRQMQRFRTLGWPTMKDEPWRFTSLKPVMDTPYTCVGPGEAHAAAITPQALEAWKLHQEGERILVFVDGHYRADLSSPPADLPQGVTSLAQALRDTPEDVQAVLRRANTVAMDALAALNGAFLLDGACLQPARTDTLPLLHLLYIATSAEQPRVSHFQNLIVVPEGGQITVVEHDGSLGAGRHWCNGITHLLAGPNSHARYYLLEESNPQAVNTRLIHAHLDRDSRVELHPALLGGGLVRNNIHGVLDGEGSHLLVNGLFVGRGQQHLDNHMRIVHARPRGESHQFYQGVLGEKAHGVFAGRIVVQPGAQQTDAKQTNRNLLLSDEARMNTQPQLEIHADDVKCTHGATVGRLDQEAVYYLQTRGIPFELAQALMTYAFAAQGLNRMNIAAVRRYLMRQLSAKLPHGRELAQMIDEPG